MALTLEMPSTAQGCGEHRLIAAARAGEDRAFEQLYSRYRERIEAFILSRVRDHGRAEDIAQEVFMSALRRLRANQQEIAFKPWIYEIAKNACIDEFRRAQRCREVSLDADQSLHGDPGALRSIAPSPPAAVENKQRLDDLRGAFGGLSDVHHKLLVMRELEGLSYDEIGSRMGMSRQMVESTLFRARRKLTAEYEEVASGRRCQQIQTVIAAGRAVSSRALGVRERRQLARHLAHCQPCRITAHLAGVDESLVRPRTIATKLAGLLPFPIWRWLGRPGRGLRQLVARKGASPPTGQALVALADQAQAPLSLGGAAVAVAVIALVGAGGAAVAVTSHDGHARTATPASKHAQAGAPGVPGARAASKGGLGIAARHVRGALTGPRAGSRTARRTTRAPVRGSSGSGGGGNGSTGSSAGTSGGATGTAGSAASAATSVTSGVAGTTQSTGSSLVGAAGNTVSQVTQGAGSTVNKVVNTVSGVVNSTAGTTSSVTGAVGNTVSNTSSTLTSTVGSTVGSVLGGGSGTTPPPTGSTTGSGTGPLGSAVGSTVQNVGSTVSSTVSNLIP